MFIYGKDDKDHDANIINLFNVAQKEGLVFNSAKCAIRQLCDLLWRCVLSQRILSRSGKDPRHFRDDISSDETRATVIPRSSELSSDFCSSSQSPYWTTMGPPKKGEQLCLGWELQCEFHTYLYGRTFIIETDHRPLEMISLKNLIAVPARLQRMLLHLQQYDMIITYRPGKEMLLADVLSQIPSRTNTEIKFNLRVDAISISAFTRSCLTKVSAETQWDPILSTVHRLTLNGWPDRWRRVPRIARNYWDYRDELSIEDELLMKGEWVVIPLSCRDSIMDNLHKSHAGINKSLSLARMYVYWPGWKQMWHTISRDAWHVWYLPVETLHPHEIPHGPWIKISAHFFQDHYGGKHLIIADYFSKFPYLFLVASAHHLKTINHLRELFAAEGAHTIVMSNNGPPFNGDDFKKFACEFNFVHTTSSPHFHQSNGYI